MNAFTNKLNLESKVLNAFTNKLNLESKVYERLYK